MKITAQTFSIVSGSTICNASCPYCISKLTPKIVDNSWVNVNWRNFNISCRMAKAANINTVLITGKGEPTLYPSMISRYLEQLEPFKFPFVELQTNGIELMKTDYDHVLCNWYDYGLTHICLSIVHYDFARNCAIFGKNYKVHLRDLVKKFHKIGFTVRLTCVVIKGGIDNIIDLNELVYIAKHNKVKQLSIRPVTRITCSYNIEKSEFDENVSSLSREESKVNEWIGNNIPDMSQINLVAESGKALFKLVHGATVYDYRGQNLCLTNSMTYNVDPNEVRQLIFFPDGSLRYDWQYEGAVLL